jgi:chromosome segregation protein
VLRTKTFEINELLEANNNNDIKLQKKKNKINELLLIINNNDAELQVKIKQINELVLFNKNKEIQVKHDTELFEQKISDLLAINKTKKKDLEQNTFELNHKNHRINELLEKIKNMDNELQSKENEIINLNNELQNIKNTIHGFSKKNVQIEIELQNKNNETTLLHKKKIELMEKNNDLQVEIECQKAYIDLLNCKNNDLLIELQNKKNELSTIRESFCNDDDVEMKNKFNKIEELFLIITQKNVEIKNLTEFNFFIKKDLIEQKLLKTRLSDKIKNELEEKNKITDEKKLLEKINKDLQNELKFKSIVNDDLESSIKNINEILAKENGLLSEKLKIELKNVLSIDF